MINEEILSKESRLIALYGVNSQESAFLKVLNATFKTLGLIDFAIGLNIKPEDFAYMAKGMPNSKVTMALYEPEFQSDIVPLLDVHDSCVSQSGLCDGAYAKDKKLFGKCFYQKSFEHLVACEKIDLANCRVLLLGAGSVGRAILPILGSLSVSFIDVADRSVENAALALEIAKLSLSGVKTDISWFQNGMEVDVKKYDIIINAIDLYAHSDKKLIKPKGENKDLVLIDFVRGQSSFDILSKELGCKKVGDFQWMTASALCIAKEWLDAKVSCEDYESIIKSFGR